MDANARRPLKSRNTGWARSLAAALARTPIQPNWISAMSVGFAAASGCCLWFSGAASGAGRTILLVSAAVFIQLRLLCNLMDGMVAVEGGKRSRTGDVFNELPDRFADLLILAPAGYACGHWPFGQELGWLAGTLALLTAYVRVLGASLGTGQDFSGPLAKQQRMAILTIACLVSIAEPHWIPLGLILYGSLIVLALGTAVTVVRRILRLLETMQARA
jgi:phosphatidylglycerophosphate synthase